MVFPSIKNIDSAMPYCDQLQRQRGVAVSLMTNAYSYYGLCYEGKWGASAPFFYCVNIFELILNSVTLCSGTYIERL